MYYLKALRRGSHSFTCKLHLACLFLLVRWEEGHLVKNCIHQMAPPLTEVADIQLQLTTHLSTQRDEGLSWFGWLTYSGRFTYISGHPSATGRAQDRESSPAKDRRSTTEPRNHPVSIVSHIVMRSQMRSMQRFVHGSHVVNNDGRWVL